MGVWQPKTKTNFLIIIITRPSVQRSFGILYAYRLNYPNLPPPHLKTRWGGGGGGVPAAGIFSLSQVNFCKRRCFCWAAGDFVRPQVLCFGIVHLCLAAGAHVPPLFFIWPQVLLLYRMCFGLAAGAFGWPGMVRRVWAGVGQGL